MIKNIKSIVVLVSICTIMCLMLACTNQLTRPIIEANGDSAVNESLSKVMPGASGFNEVDLTGKELPDTVAKAYVETSGMGHVFLLETTGYKDGLELLCGVTLDGTITGATCVASSETNGEEKTYGDNFVGKNLEGVEAVDTVSGSTMTTTAYKNAMKDALNAATILGGGSVDLRNPDQILADNLAAALPEGDAFQKWFATEVIEGVDAIYVADNKAGYVCAIGEEFVAVDANGNSDNAVAAAAVKKLRDSMPSDEDFAGKGLNENIKAVQKTTTGNYIIDIDGLGYAYYDDNHGYGEQRFVPIKIRVSLTPDGTIIDCLTVSHEESKNIGDICGKEEYYGQFDGKNAETYKEVEAISGATYTTNGYMNAILRCFEAVAILEGRAK